jgi:hypothetical protein
MAIGINERSAIDRRSGDAADRTDCALFDARGDTGIRVLSKQSQIRHKLLFAD